MKIRINGYNYDIKSLSELSVSEYMIIVDKLRYTNLISYISAMSGIDIDKAEVEGIGNIDAAERQLLDVGVDFINLEVPNIYNDEIVKHLYKRNFGYKYVFNLYRNKYNNDEMGIIELCVYALAITLSKEEEYADVETIFESLMKENWMKILPIGFFLSKKLKTKKNYLITFLMRLILKFSLKPKKHSKTAGMHTT